LSLASVVVHGGTVRRKLLLLGLAICAACTTTSSSSSIATPSETASSAGSASSVEPPPPSASPVSAARIVLQPAAGSFLVRGLYPKVQSRCKHAHRGMIRARYPGAVSVRSADDGTLSLTVALPFERYLEGIAEVPPSWPAAALEAQAIAARSYALAHIGFDGPDGAEVQKPICATTDCQVYGGIAVPPTPGIRRWYAAVRRTAGQALVFDGRPADTVYFSTSNGHTYGNEDVFGSSPLPYLRPVVERDDGASPESRWTVPLPFRDLATFLSSGGEWSAGTRIRSVARDGSQVVVKGPGVTRSIDADSFRYTVNEWASCLQPSRYPTDSLPTTIPSGWYDVTSTHGRVIVTGRGWGHGAGMVQWGAYGKAKRGWSAARILSYYYGGLRPVSYPEPGLIHVIVATGLESLAIDAPASGATLNGAALGPGTVRLTGDDQGVVTAVL
jgi:SpoIID/LytB domain protein